MVDELSFSAYDAGSFKSVNNFYVIEPLEIGHIDLRAVCSINIQYNSNVSEFLNSWKLRRWRKVLGSPGPEHFRAF